MNESPVNEGRTTSNEVDDGVPALEHDLSREASDSMRGFRFQLLCSVKEWLNLKDGQRLYLECAEDFDTVSSTEATTTQVKDTPSQRLTLRSPDVVAAISNYWDLRGKNLDKKILFQFLSTAEVTFEQGKPFEVPGITLWNQVRKRSLLEVESQVEELKQFLLTLQLSSELITFLTSATLEQFVEGLIVPIEWITSSPDSGEVEREILERLVEYGATQQASPSRCKQVFCALYFQASKVITQKVNRHVSKADWLTVFEEVTINRISSDAYARFFDFVESLGGNTSSLSPNVIQSSILTEPPPLPPKFLRRENVTSAINTQLSATGSCIVWGMTGTGKTCLLVDALGNRGSRWVNFRGYEIEQINSALEALETLTKDENLDFDVVIEDLNIDADFRRLEAPLLRIAKNIKSRGYRLLITSEKKIPDRIARNLEAEPILVQPFSELEIAEFLRTFNFPSETLVKKWAPLLLGLTSGHPQLLQARISYLVSSGCPEPDVDLVFSQPKGVEDVYTEARSLIASLESAASSLVYRLSLTIRPLSRDQIIDIGQIAPKIDRPGAVLDLLAPWIEEVGNHRYRISPLARNAGTEVHGTDWARRTHSSIALALLKKNTLTQDDVAEILLHALVGDKLANLVWIILGKDLIQQNDDVLAAIYRAFPLIVSVGLYDGTKLEIHQEVLFMFRLLQYRLAVAGGSPEQKNIIARFDKEYPKGEPDPDRVLPRFMWLCQRLLIDCSLSLEESFLIASELFALMESVAELFRPTVNAGEWKEWYQTFLEWPFFCVAHKIKSADDIDELLRLLSVDTKLARNFLSPTDNNESIATAIRFKPLRLAIESGIDEKEKLLHSIDELKKFSENLGLTILPQICAYTSLELLCDHLNRVNDALELANQFSEAINNSCLVQITKARILSIHGNDIAASEIWSNALKNNTSNGDFDVDYLLAFRGCACAFARLKRYKLSAEYFDSAVPFCSLESLGITQVGLSFDAGQSHLLDGQFEKAINSFKIGVKALLSIRGRLAQDDLLPLERRANYLLAWNLEDDTSRAKKGWEPPVAGFCSDMEPLSKGDSTPIPPEAILCHLVKLEYAKTGSLEAYEQYGDIIKASHHPGITHLIFQFEFLKAFNIRDCNKLIRISVDYADRLLEQTKSSDYEGSAISSEELNWYVVTNLLAVCLIYFRDFGKIDEGLISLIDSLTRNTTYSVIAGEFCTTLREFLIEKASNPQAIMSVQSERPLRRIVAAFAMATLCDTTPEHLLVSQISLLEILGKFHLRDSLVGDLASLFREGWSEMIKRPHLFPSPRLSIPSFLSAIDSEKTGWAKIKLLLTTAKDELPNARLGVSVEFLKELPDD